MSEVVAQLPSKRGFSDRAVAPGYWGQLLSRSASALKWSARRLWSHRSRLVPLRVVTAADSSHFRSLMQLLDSLGTHEPESEVVVYDLGLLPEQRDQVARYVGDHPLVSRRDFDYAAYPAHFDVSIAAGQYAWKPAIIAGELLRCTGQFLVWLDAGDRVEAPMRNVRTAIACSKLWSPRSSGTVSEWTHPGLLTLIGPAQRHLTSSNLNGAIVGVDSGSPKARAVVNLWALAAREKSWIAPVGSSRDNHRQDQSLLTLLVLWANVRPVPRGTLEVSTHQDID